MSAQGIARLPVHRVRLAEPHQRQLDALIRTRGITRTARDLGLSVHTVTQLADGGCASAATCERVAERLCGVVR